MNRRDERTLTLAEIIKAAMPRDATKRIARALGCSDRQARTIVEGRPPGRLRRRLLALLDAEIARNLAILEMSAADVSSLQRQEAARPASPLVDGGAPSAAGVAGD